VPSEGYDPLRLITAQSVKSNMMILLDTSAAMATAADGSTSYYVKTSSSGGNAAPTAMTTTEIVDWFGGLSWVAQGSGTCGGAQCSTWSYSLEFIPPSRMALIKNVLGSSIDVVASYSPPSTWPTATCTAPGGDTCTVVSQTPTFTSPYTWTWTINFVKSSSGNPDTVALPSPPFTAYDSITRQPVTGAGGADVHAHQDLVGNTASFINWGLAIFPTSTSDASLSCTTGEATIAVPIDTSDASGAGSKSVNVIEALLEPNATSTCLTTAGLAGGTCSGNSANGYLYHGVGASGSTTSVAALEYAKSRLKNVHDGGTNPLYAAPYPGVLDVTYYPTKNGTANCQFGLFSSEFGSSANDCNVTSAIATADSKAASCTRNYGVLFASAGTSTKCNTGDVAWTGCTSSDTVDTYPAGVARDITNITGTVNGTTTNLNPKVWVLGPSSSASSQTLCELNRTAMQGKTDRTSPNGDYGFDTTQDTARLTSYVQDDGYAFYGTSPTDILTAFNKDYAPGAGDYPTAVPIALGASIFQLKDLTKTQALLASTSYPSWQGHVRLIDYAIADPTAQVAWDAGSDLSTPLLAGNVTNPAYVSKANRQIYTWDSSNALVAVTSANISTLRTIAESYGMSATAATTYITDSFVDFVRGGDGSATGTSRCWILGPVVNSTPAVIADPPTFSNFKGTAESHENFETIYARGSTVSGGVTTYTGRLPLVWVGADDGMIHAFALTDSSPNAGDAGREVLALLPPNMISTVYSLYYNYATYTTGCSDTYQTGQPTGITNHVYGPAQSMRFADIYDANGSSSSNPPNNYRTVMYVTEGPGGDLIAAVDVTHPTTGDPGCSTQPCVSVLWSYVGSTGPNVLSGLKKSWSVPAVGTGATDGSLWYAVFGSGQNTASTVSSSVDGSVFTLNALSGAVLNTETPPNNESGPTNTFVGNQDFANSVLFKRSTNGQKFDDVVDSGLQGDLIGHVHPLSGPTFNDNRPASIINAWDVTNISVNQHVAPDLAATPPVQGDYNLTTPTLSGSQAQPIYYPPTVSGIRSSTGCDIFAFGSGSINERSSNVNGSNTGTGTDGTHFIPSIFAASKTKSSGATSVVPASSIVRTALASIHKVVKGTSGNTSGVDISPNCTSGVGGDGCLSTGTQLSGPTTIAVPLSDTTAKGQAIGLFLVYDPAVSYKTCTTPSINAQTGARTCSSDTTVTTCTGGTYVIFQALNPSVDTNGSCQTAAPTVANTNAYFVGAGISSGMAIGQGNQLIFARSGAGTNAATVVQTGSIPPVNPGGSGTVSPTWWQELK
jgi:hypothetical protein